MFELAENKSDRIIYNDTYVHVQEGSTKKVVCDTHKQ